MAWHGMGSKRHSPPPRPAQSERVVDDQRPHPLTFSMQQAAGGDRHHIKHARYVLAFDSRVWLRLGTIVERLSSLRSGCDKTTWHTLELDTLLLV